MFRKTDPETSRRAAEDFIESGKYIKRKDQIAYLVRRFPGSTHGELAARMYEVYRPLGILCCAETPHKRLAELEREGRAYWTGERKCSETHNIARVWYPT